MEYAFLGGGGGPFPTVSGSFDESDLVTVSIGGNDARFYQQNGGTLAGAPAAATVSAAFAEAGLDALVGAGAQNISFLAGNTSILPEIAGDTSAQAIRNSYSTTFNAQMQDVLAGYAANGVMVHYLDLTLVGQQIIANPGAYGFTNTGACTPAPSCVTDSNYANQYLFYVDALHLTSAGLPRGRPVYCDAAPGPADDEGAERARARDGPSVRPHLVEPRGPRLTA